MRILLALTTILAVDGKQIVRVASTGTLTEESGENSLVRRFSSTASHEPFGQAKPVEEHADGDKMVYLGIKTVTWNVGGADGALGSRYDPFDDSKVDHTWEAIFTDIVSDIAETDIVVISIQELVDLASFTKNLLGHIMNPLKLGRRLGAMYSLWNDKQEQKNFIEEEFVPFLEHQFFAHPGMQEQFELSDFVWFGTTAVAVFMRKDLKFEVRDGQARMMGEDNPWPKMRQKGCASLELFRKVESEDDLYDNTPLAIFRSCHLDSANVAVRQQQFNYAYHDLEHVYEEEPQHFVSGSADDNGATVFFPDDHLDLGEASTMAGFDEASWRHVPADGTESVDILARKGVPLILLGDFNDRMTGVGDDCSPGVLPCFATAEPSLTDIFDAAAKSHEDKQLSDLDPSQIEALWKKLEKKPTQALPDSGYTELPEPKLTIKDVSGMIQSVLHQPAAERKYLLSRTDPLTRRPASGLAHVGFTDFLNEGSPGGSSLYEMEVRFPPTYKFKVQEDGDDEMQLLMGQVPVYDVRRAPAWTDRIMWGNPVTLPEETLGPPSEMLAIDGTYRWVRGTENKVASSDHIPVTAMFALRLPVPLPRELDLD